MPITNRQGGGFYLGQSAKQCKSCFRLYVKGADVMVRFSEEESEDVKCRVRDILTGAYGERLQRENLLCGDTEQTG